MTDIKPRVFNLGLAYDDVLILPQHSEILPHEANLETKLSRNIKLKIPLLSAAMDTVTESKSAIIMARSGGIGIVHKNLTIDDHAEEIRAVKKSESGIVKDPVTVSPSQTVADVQDIMKRVKFSGFPVVENGRLVGIITGRDLRFEKDPRRLVADVMTKNVITCPPNTSAEEAEVLLHKHRIEKLPVVDSDQKTLLGMYTFKDISKAKTFPNASKDSSGRLLVGAAIGAGGDYLERAEALLSAGVDVLVVDTAHGHSQGVINAVKAVRANFKRFTFDLIAGNIATPQAVEALAAAGVDAVKVGIGPGSICTTRIVAGIGVPQFTAVLNCAAAAKKLGIPVIADGGVKFSGDIVKALAAGASTVMIGSLFAGTDEAPGDLIFYQGKSFKQYRGMGSIGAMRKGSRDRYFQANVQDPGKLVPEGIEGRIPYRGSLADNIFQLTGGIRSAMGYIGAPTIAELYERAEFVQITASGLKESHVHDVYITHEAPNYKLD